MTARDEIVRAIILLGALWIVILVVFACAILRASR